MNASCRFELLQHDDGLRVRFCEPEREPLEGPCQIDPSSIQRALQKIERGDCRLDDLREVGSHLWNALQPHPIKARFKDLRAAAVASNQFIQIELQVHVADASLGLDRLPWESLFDELERNFLALDARYSVYRAPPPGFVPPTMPPRPGRGPLKVLAILPQGTNLALHREWQQLSGLENEVGPERLILTSLYESVTIAGVRKALTRASYDVIHYLGHGKLTADGPHIALNEDGTDQPHWLDAAYFAQLVQPSGAELIVLNCCSSAAPAEGGLADMGTRLMQISRVPAVIAMRHEIRDRAAIKFADVFYRSLLRNVRTQGRVDLALREARHILYGESNQPGGARTFITPVLAVAEGWTGAIREPAPAEQNPPAARRAALPAEDASLASLVAALKRGQVVPVVGPGVGWVAQEVRKANDGEPPKTRSLPQLIWHLANGCDYPEKNALGAVSTEPPLAASVLLARVCQYYQHRTSRGDLLHQVSTWYRGADIPEELRRIARWPVPGIIYSPVDGLMGRALDIESRTHNELSSLDRRAESSGVSAHAVPFHGARGGNQLMLLVNLKGSVAEDKSLILTETDHEKLWSNLSRPPTEFQGLITPSRRSLLFLGLSPRDAIARRIAAQTEWGSERSQGPCYFVHTENTLVDEAWWKTFDVRWVKHEPSTAIELLTAALEASA